MKKNQIVMNENMMGMPFSRALELSRAVSGMTYEQIAQEMDLGRETIHRYFTDPDYQPSAKRLPKLCTVLKNDILMDWACMNAGGYFVRVGCGPRDVSLDIQVANLTKEFGDVLRTDGEARLDGEYTAAELAALDREIADLIVKGQQMREIIKRRCLTA